MKHWKLKLALLLALVATAAGVGPSLLPARTAACNPPPSSDSVCRKKAILRVRMRLRPAKEVSTNAAPSVPPRSGVSLAAGGITDLFLDSDAECQAFDYDLGGTSLQTRQPTAALFTQFSGLTLCTMADGRIVQESGCARLLASARAGGGSSAVEPSTKTRFGALLEPGAVLQVAVRSGGLLITLSNGKKESIRPDEELVIELSGPNGTIEINRRPAIFSSFELRLFEFQGKLIK